MKRLISALTCFVLASCGTLKTAPASELIISGEGLYSLIISDYELIPSQGSSINDRFYVLPSFDWYTNVFHPAVQQRLGNRKGVPESGDCDDFVIMACSVASELNWGHGRAALPVGPLSYVRGPNDAHMIVIFAYNDDGKPRIGYYEPQGGGSFPNLIEEEIARCQMWRFP